MGWICVPALEQICGEIQLLCWICSISELGNGESTLNIAAHSPYKLAFHLQVRQRQELCRQTFRVLSMICLSSMVFFPMGWWRESKARQRHRVCATQDLQQHKPRLSAILARLYGKCSRVEGEHALVLVNLVVGAGRLDSAEVGSDQNQYFFRDDIAVQHGQYGRHLSGECLTAINQPPSLGANDHCSTQYHAKAGRGSTAV